MPRKRHHAEEIVAKLRQVDVLTSQGQSVADAIRSIGVNEVTYYLYGRLSHCKSISISAQVAIDIAKITCHQFATYKIAHPDKIAIWLNGYFNGKRGDMVVDSQELAGNTDKVQEYCIKNPDMPLMQAVETLFGSPN